MKKYTTYLLLVLILWNVSASVCAAEIKSKAFLWKVISDSSTVYVMGSIHFATDDMYPLGSEVEAAFLRSDYLVVEADAGKAAPGEIRKLTEKHALFSPETRLSANIPAETLGRLRTALARYGLTVEYFDEMRPWFAASNLSSLYLMFEGYSPESGIDFYFMNNARGVKPILELESVEQQLSAFSTLSNDLQLQYLEAAIDDIGKPPAELRQMIAAWKTGDLRKFDRIIRASFEGKPELMPVYETLYTRRNIRMSEKIGAYLTTGETYFVVVGAGHIGGEGGILDLLSHEGYRIRQVEKGQVNSN